MKYKLAIFDMDGTILSTLDDLANGVDYALSENGLPARSKQETRAALGRGVRFLIEQSVPAGLSDAEISKVEEDFLKYYKVHSMDNTRPYDGIVELIKEVRASGVKTAVVSNKIDSAVKELCANFFEGAFDVAYGERIGIPRKPDPKPINAIIDEFGLSKNEVVYIGDSEVDLLTANNAKIDHIIVTWGFRDRAFLERNGAKNLVESMEELKKEICK
ncbi:MAG: HAD family hydrolase [[Eubacterium] sulci]|nr:HAD family hydrolase [[Eubacterium] sulci]